MNYVQLTDQPEGEDEKVRFYKRSHHDSIDLQQKMKDPRLKFWLEEEGLLCLQKDLYSLTLADLATVTPDEMKQLSYNCNTSHKIRFKNAIKSLQNRGSLNKTKDTRINPTKYDDIFKIILIGDCEVGKSSILNRFAKDEFEPFYKSTMGLTCKDQIIHLETPQKSVKLQVYDMSGNHEEFGTISKVFFRGAHCILFVYDITNKKSFANTERWIEKSDMYADKDADPKTWKMIVGNKCDLMNKRVITKEQRQQLADEYGMKSIECSAKKGNNIDELFSIAAQYLLETGKPKTCCCVIL